MKKLISNIITSMLLFCMVICGGCDSEKKMLPYNDGVSFDATLKDSFLNKEENRINIAYKNENYDPNDPESEKYFYDGTLPSYRVIMITEQMNLDEVFETVPIIDFETRMTFIIIFSAFGSCRNSLDNIEKKDDILEITIKQEQTGMVTAPYLVDWVLQIDKLNISDIVIAFTE